MLQSALCIPKGCSGDLGKESRGYPQLAAQAGSVSSYPLCCTGFEGKSLLLFLLCMQPTGTRGARPSNVQSRQVLVGWTGRKGLQHLQLGDEEKEETHVKQLPTTIHQEETHEILCLCEGRKRHMASCHHEYSRATISKRSCLDVNWGAGLRQLPQVGHEHFRSAPSHLQIRPAQHHPPWQKGCCTKLLGESCLSKTCGH